MATDDTHTYSGCPLHRDRPRRANCRRCNAEYMKVYQRARRLRLPEAAIFERARERARRSGVRFTLRRADIFLPRACPALGLELRVGGGRSQNSPALDRVDPAKGYTPENVRVISDLANQLKGGRNAEQLYDLAGRAPLHLRDKYWAVARYVEREELLTQVRLRASFGGSAGADWARIASFLERQFREGYDRHNPSGFAMS